MPIQVVCSNAQCRKPLKVRDELADKKVKCPKCETVTQVTEDRVLPFLQLGSYSLVRKIGEGGMGSVYEGVQTKLDRQVALKVLPKSRTEDTAFLERFEREAKAAAALNHPNIVQVYDIGEDGGSHFFAMEFVDGEDLSQRLERDTKLPLEDGLSIVLSVAKALRFAHSRTIIHRDIKPDNIMVSREGEIKLADMGLAKSVEEDKGVTATGVGLGTPYYMAPEQAEDARRADHRSDIYALGITLLHLLTGQRPFDGATAVSVILAHREQSLPTGKELGTELPPNVEALIRKMCAKAPDKRYADYDALLIDFEKVTAGERIAGQLPVGRSALSKFREAPTVSDPSKLPKGRPSSIPQASKAPMAIAVAGVLLFAGAGIYFATRGSSSSPPSPVATTSVSPKGSRSSQTEDDRPEWLKRGLPRPDFGFKPLDENELQALRRQQEETFKHYKKIRDEARKLTHRYDYAAALRKYDELAAVPEMKNQQNFVANGRKDVEQGAKVFAAALKAINHHVGKRIILSQKTYTLKSFDNRKLVLDSAGKEIEMNVTEISGLDVFRLASPEQKKLGADGWNNLWRFAAGSRDMGALMPKFLKEFRQAGVETQNAVGARLKPVLSVGTTPFGATVRIISRSPNPKGLPVDSTPWFTSYSSTAVRDVDLNTTYVLEISKKGYQTVERTVKVEKGAVTGVFLFLLKSELAENFALPTDKNDQHGNPARQRLDKETNYPLEIVHKRTGMSFVFIKPGEFKTDSIVNKPDSPRLTVRITRPYYLGKYEVTVNEWNLVQSGDPGELNRSPVSSITAVDRLNFIAKLNESLTGRHENPPVQFAYPTESQWEYACRAGTTTDHSFGKDSSREITSQFAWYGVRSKRKYQKVGQKKPNPWGLYDMHGNLWEWVRVWEGDSLSKRTKDRKPPQEKEENRRILRGGSLWDSAEKVSSSHVRNEYLPLSHRDALMGVRLSLRLGAYYEPAAEQADPPPNRLGDRDLEALRRQQEQAYSLSRKTDAEAWKLAGEYDYKGATKLYDALAADPRFKYLQNTIANQKQMVRDASEAFSSAMSGISIHFLGKTPITVGGKKYTIVGSKPGQLTLEIDGKETVIAIKEISGSDLFRLAVPDQKKLGIDGYINLFRFASMARDAKSLGPKVARMLEKENVNILKGLLARLKPVLMVTTEPPGATIRIKSQIPDIQRRPIDPTPFFSLGMRDAELNTTYVLEFSKKGYDTIEHTVKVTKPGPTVVSLVLKKTSAPVKPGPQPGKLDDLQLEALRQQQRQIEKESVKIHNEAIGLAMKYEYAEAIKRLNAQAKDPRFKNRQNEIYNWRVGIGAAQQVYESAIQAIRNQQIGSQVTLDGKKYELVGPTETEVYLKTGGKGMKKPYREIKHADIFRLATAAQKKLGADGYTNLSQFVLMSGPGRKELMQPVMDMRTKAKVDVNAAEMARFKPLFKIHTEPVGATIRVRSYKPARGGINRWLDAEIVHTTPLFSPVTIDAEMDRIYLFEVSKEGYLTVEHMDKSLRVGPQIAKVKLKESEGFTNLFAGDPARGWEQCGPGEFQFRPGLATATGGMGLWWYKSKEFIDFVLRLEYVLQQNANSGVFVRFPDPGDNPRNAVQQGYEIAILKEHNRPPGREIGGNPTGSIFSFKDPWAFPQKPMQQWNSMEITCVGQSYFVRLNGELVNYFVGDRKLSGHIGLQNNRTLISFRNVHIKELKGAEGYNTIVKLSKEMKAAKKKE